MGKAVNPQISGVGVALLVTGGCQQRQWEYGAWAAQCTSHTVLSGPAHTHVHWGLSLEFDSSGHQTRRDVGRSNDHTDWAENAAASSFAFQQTSAGGPEAAPWGECPARLLPPGYL